MEPWVYTLTEAEQAIARYLGKARYDAARAKGIADEKIGPQSTDLTDLEGLAAELAFCRLLNVYPDLDIGHRPSFDARYGTVTIDVKSTTYPHGRLLVRATKQPHPADWYALVTGTFPGPYRLAGLFPASLLFTDRYLMDLGHGPTYVIQQHQLYDPDSFFQYANG